MGRKPDLLDELNAAEPSEHTAILKKAAGRRRQRFWFNGYFTGVLGYAVLRYVVEPGNPPPPMAVRIAGELALGWLPGAVVLGVVTLLWPMFFGALDGIDDFLKPWMMTAPAERNLR